MEPHFCLSLSKCGPETVVTWEMTLQSKNPLAIAKAMLPPPMKPTFAFWRRSLNSVDIFLWYDKQLLQLCMYFNPTEIRCYDCYYRLDTEIPVVRVILLHQLFTMFVNKELSLGWVKMRSKKDFNEVDDEPEYVKMTKISWKSRGLTTFFKKATTMLP